MKTKTIELYKFHELSKAVKAKVIDRERYINTEDGFWHKYPLEEWEQKLKELGFENPKISFTGFCSQGDGASFTCEFVDVPLFIAKQGAKKRFSALLKAIKADEAEANASVNRIDHHYSHEYTVAVETEIYHNHDEDDAAKYTELEKQEGELRGFILDVVRTLSRKIYRELEQEYDGLTSDEAVKDTLESNDYWFTSSGRMEYTDD